MKDEGWSLDTRDIVDKLLDFERCGLTAASRVNLRESAAIEIFRLRQQVAKPPEGSLVLKNEEQSGPVSSPHPTSEQAGSK